MYDICIYLFFVVIKMKGKVPLVAGGRRQWSPAQTSRGLVGPSDRQPEPAQQQSPTRRGSSSGEASPEPRARKAA